MKRGDKWLILVLVVTSVSLYLAYSLKMMHAAKYEGKTFARIELNGELYKKVELTAVTQEIKIVTNRGYDLLRISNYGIEVVESDCPDKICMSYGFIDKVGEMIICLPNRMVVEIVGDSGSSPAPEFDYLLY